MNYIELECKIIPEFPGKEIITAQLADIGFESFVESDNAIFAYIPENNFNENEILKLPVLNSEHFKISINHKLIKEQNWNKAWESNYEPVLIAGKCFIRAPFHPPNKNSEYEIIIEPQMSFGTAHHETTSLMIEMMMNESLKQKSILDMGCGTGILAILSYKMEAENITAIDNDEWAYKNTLDNLNKNNIPCIKVLHGDANLLGFEKYDIILANINRNILLNDISKYSSVLNNNGILVMSGFYKRDLEMIKAEAEKFHLEFENYLLKNNWVAAKFIKITFNI
ncbi:MAG: 50S ribosomal protein L11 methyltransferase [Bacteroidales bacterium]|nr:50S ribosomal protein L11 methyltransferase [Bacteroidales bacterium]